MSFEKKSQPRQRVLVLGSGFVAAPLLRYLLQQPDIHVTVAGADKARAESLVNGSAHGNVLELDVQTDAALLDRLVAASDVVVSLLPYTYHVQVARRCLQHGVHLVTTSYVSSAMRELDAEVQAKKLLFLNEAGLDPGIDHMSAMRIIHAVQQKGGKILGFESCCGGLPAPEAADNPLRYKFSWSPRGVLLAGRNSAQFRRQGQIVRIENKELFHSRQQRDITGLGVLELYPNRDSLQYQDLYGLAEAELVFRGTFRYPGWCETMAQIVRLGLLDDSTDQELSAKTWRQVMAGRIGYDGPDLRQNVAHHLQLAAESAILDRLHWLGLFDSIPLRAATLLDSLVLLMQERMAYKAGERDMVVLQHDFSVQYPGHIREHITSLLVDYGEPGGDSAMSRTVGLPAALAVHLILKKAIRLVGVHIPLSPEIYEPILHGLADMGLVFRETVAQE
jgi:saccharopine dehydrogenase (NADP+, L-glutamate forming)